MITRLARVVLVAVSAAAVVLPASAASAVSTDVDCVDFSYQEDAQDHLDGQIGDPDRLDADGDGIACETLPHRPVSAAPALSSTSVYRFWNPSLSNAHLFTMSALERDTINSTYPSWIDEGRAFAAWQPVGGECPGATPVYRFYSARYLHHFYTASDAEKLHIIATDPDWTFEGVAYCASTSPVTGSVPMYRFWSPRFGQHHFTANRAESRQLRTTDTANWQYEGIAYYVLP
ncbi:excalibur calcium-binding domain-containing protein [Cellulomonas xylanilytica]|uniref:DUF5648 domain-containing protein n=1 Tax=Cellulomonas xylanilytica TaxID=233583 RepID=A0A510UY99_9CELL|nr:excalibur calcium-binding domain-containing protein [Cellulomonas xylanilytica]GEK19637.1 hypothetical protein CXY01_01570 [Cellulomonas xylanilytica]